MAYRDDTAPPGEPGSGYNPVKGTAIGFLSEETVAQEFVACLLNLMRARFPDILNRVIYARGYAGRLDVGRSTVAKIFLEQTDAEYLLLLDSDMVFTAEQYDMLKVGMQKLDTPAIVSGLYSQVDGRPCVFKEDDDGVLHNVQYEDLIGHRYYEAASVGLGFALVHRGVFANILEHTYDGAPLPFFDNTAKGHAGQPLADDSSFCVRSNDAGCQVYVDTKVQIGHLKRVTMYPRIPDSGIAVPEKKLVVPSGVRTK